MASARSLRTVVATRGPLAEDAQRALARDLARALARWHRGGRVHGRLTPGAVGLAPTVALTPGSDQIADTAGYSAPEVLTGGDTGAAADIFAFGAVLVFAATGAGPFGPGSPLRVLQRTVEDEPDLRGVPDGLRELALECLAKDPDRRPDAEQLVARLTDPAVPPGLPASARYVLIAGGLVAAALIAFGAVLVFDRDTTKPTPSAALAEGPVRIAMPGVSDIAVTPDGRRVYLANRLQNTVTVLDATTNTVADVLPVPGQPTGLAVTADGTRVFVVTSNAVATIDTRAGEVSGQIVLDASTVYDDIAVTPDGSRLYLADGSRSTVSVIDPGAGAASATIPLRTSAHGRVSALQMAPDGRSVYVGHTDRLTILDTATDTVRAEFPYAGTPERMAVSPDGRFVYLLRFAPTVSVFDTTAQAFGEVRLSGIGIDAVAEPAGRYVFIAGQSLPPDDGMGVLVAVDIATGAEVGALTFVPGAGRVAVAPDGRHVYAADRNGAGLLIIDVTHFAR
ncbi:beta-propeller fold lactonase family protein [Nocardia sp. NPDC052566]|uniref:beta-propeller fold lactonase family protein n=1 Tax=Nocardia sp. NPDC052566 TaxID=3364330 RepID=UPI0037C58FC6